MTPKVRLPLCNLDADIYRTYETLQKSSYLRCYFKRTGAAETIPAACQTSDFFFFVQSNVKIKGGREPDDKPGPPPDQSPEAASWLLHKALTVFTVTLRAGVNIEGRLQRGFHLSGISCRFKHLI